MGKYAATRAFQRKNPTRDNTFRSVLGPIRDKSDYQFQSFLYNADVTGLYRGYIASRDSTNYMSDYLANTGQNWSDIRYPSRTTGFAAAGGFANSAVIFSSNIAKLYL